MNRTAGVGGGREGEPTGLVRGKEKWVGHERFPDSGLFLFFVFCFSFGWLHTSLIPPLRETGFVRNEVLFFLSETISND